MKPHIVTSILLLSLVGSAFAAHRTEKMTMPPISTNPGKFYVGAFGGGGSTSNINLSQYGTAYYFEALGGPLAVNAFGNTNSQSAWMGGGQIGYQFPQIALDANSQFSLSPAGELEAYGFGSTTFTGNLTNNTTRLLAHDFVNEFPMDRTVFLVNAVVNFNINCIRFHPYVGVGFGSAIVKISGATATQVDPPEAGVNHFNAKASDTDTTFAGQVKLGVSYDVIDNVSLFAEYRWLYLSNTHFTFGSTVYPAHPATGPWLADFGSQSTNMGAVGIRFSV